MQLAPIVDRLKTTCPAFQNRVIDALEEGAVAKAFPAAYVLPLSDKGDSNKMAGAHRQRMEHRFAVEIMVKHAGQAATGGPAAASLEAVRDSVKAALRGWSPAGLDPIDYAAGRLIQFEAGRVTWRDEYTTKSYE